MKYFLNIFNNKKFVALVAIVLIISGVLAVKNWPIVKYEIRRIKLSLFRGDIAGGTMIMLPATYHRQEHSLSCEIAALKIALSVYDVHIPESELISKLKFDPTPRTSSTWGDPFTGFVGNIDGKMMRDGYGVYWDPIEAVGDEYLDAQVKKFTSQTLAQELADGHPVVSWGYFGRGKKYTWTTPEGKKITAVNGEHARTIVGFSGSVESPTHFIIYDPIYGKLIWKTKDLMNNWAPFENTGIVVYPKLTLTQK
jgi:uncharacterized protein YvpB